jgi:hypothetical protein
LLLNLINRKSAVDKPKTFHLLCLAPTACNLLSLLLLPLLWHITGDASTEPVLHPGE